MPVEMTLYQKLSFIASQPDLDHVVTTWKTTCLYFSASIIEESKGEGSVYKQSRGSVISHRPNLQARYQYQQVFNVCSSSNFAEENISDKAWDNMCIPTHLSHCDCSNPYIRISPPPVRLESEKDKGEHPWIWLHLLLSFKSWITRRYSSSYRDIVKPVPEPWDSIQNLQMPAKSWGHSKAVADVAPAAENQLASLNILPDHSCWQTWQAGPQKYHGP